MAGPSGGDSQARDKAIAIARRAIAAHRAGRLGEAIAAYRSALELWPRFPEAHNNLGLALRAAGRAQDAVASYRQAIALQPGYAAAQSNLAALLVELGDAAGALRHAVEAERLAPGNPGTRRVLADSLRRLRFAEAGPAVLSAMELCLSDPHLDHQPLAAAALSLLRLDPAVGRALDLAGQPAALATAVEAGELAPVFSNRLLLALMNCAILPDPDFERLQTALRRHCLRIAAETPAPPLGLVHDDPAFAAALAMQAFLTDYAWAETEEESALLERVADRNWPAPLAFALYRPLHQHPGAADLPGQPAGALADLTRQQVAEPKAERAIAESLPALTPVAGETSEAVRGQYEANPYPRWLATAAKTPRPFHEVLCGLFPMASLPAPKHGPLRVLVAGCGTGKHAIEVATRFAGAEVLAVDLSRPSLAYGARRAKEMGLDNLRFAQADILALGALAERFDLIESVGVLHHLADPLAGWRVLIGLLAPGGVMRIGLYSRRARRGIAASRDNVRNQGFAADPAGLRAARQAVLALPEDHPARAAAGQLDFYSLGGCRDLLFNVQERDTDLPEIAAALDDLGLEFLGFEFPDATPRRAYTARFPEDPAATDLALWDRFEGGHPDTFQAMYQFWCRARTGV